MNRKRWIALFVAALLLIVSFGMELLFFTLFDNTSKMAAHEFTEKIIEEGSSLEKLVVLEVNGIIQETEAVPLFFETASYNHQQFLRMLEAAAEDPLVKGIILRVNSPGGGVVESAEIHHKLEKIKAEYNLPIYVSMASVAASGGYYISAPADKIFASNETLTGSLGVIMQGYNYAELAEKIGIKVDTIKSGEYKDIMSPAREMTAEEQQILQQMVDNSFNRFVQVIAEGRGLSEQEVRKIADGRIYDGSQAKEIGLVDEIGYLEDTIEDMKETYNIADPTVVKYTKGIGFSSILEMTAKRIASPQAAEILPFLFQPNAPRLMYLYTR